MQIQIQGLLQFAVPLFPSAEVSQTRATTAILESSGSQIICGAAYEVDFPVIVYVVLSAERPGGHPACAQFLRGQSAPADRPAGLQGAQQGSSSSS